MQIILIIIGVVIIAALAYVIFLLTQKVKTKEGDQSLVMLQNQINEMNKTLDNKLAQSHQAMQAQFSQSAKIISNVTEKLTKLDDTNKQVIGFANQLQSLENILKNPKQRGVLGEYFLETVLKNVLPPNSYQFQYKFKNGETVDAVVFIKDKIVPIDSKFSLENYNRIVEEQNKTAKEQLQKEFKADLKKRIDETSKYIRPDENTMDFAFMFIPSEGIYYDLLVNQVGAIKVNTRDLIEYAFKEKHVVIVSPTSFLAYLQTVLQGLRAMQMEDSVKEIIKQVGQLSKHLLAYDDYFKKVGNNLSTTVNMYNSASKEFAKIDKDVMKISGESNSIEARQLERPKTE